MDRLNFDLFASILPVLPECRLIKGGHGRSVLRFDHLEFRPKIPDLPTEPEHTPGFSLLARM